MKQNLVTGSRVKKTRVKTAKGRIASSTRWLQRQINDPFVLEAKKLGYRARSAFKIIELNEQFHLFKPGKKVVDLGAAPGGWTQVIIDLVSSKAENPSVVALDILPMEPLPGAKIITMDFMAEDAPKLLKEAAGGPVDAVVSDMAANTTGNHEVDHLRIMALVEEAYNFAVEILNEGGAFVAKVFQGGTEQNLLARIKKDFKEVKHAKPAASRKESSEFYIVAKGFRKK
ncbi:MAG: RlmE family RNA methyltransferase [Alphaproteobacteria bacterium]|nr:RlmE family RNA methyltransferase [Elusimicrobiaceae bacterium]MBR7158071.1 RlmE family RNA methyltransferase [Alphaproteobacteria bacterium]